MKTDLSISVEQARKLVKRLREEKDPTNDAWIAILEKQILAGINKAYDKYFRTK